jgi:drug/metabolite transporter (DMT)-like permease
MSPTRHATIMLLVVTAFWSLSFPLVSAWQEEAARTLGDPLLSAFTLIALRMIPALGLLVLWQPRLIRDLTGTELMAGASLGVIFFAGFTLQTWGMATVSPSLSAFLTSLCSVWAPLLGWVILSIRVAPIMLVGLILAVSGTALLVMKPGMSFSPTQGDLLTTAASVLFGVQLLVLDRLGRKVRSGSLTVGFFGVTGLLALLFGLGRATSGDGVGTWASWVVDYHRDGRMLWVVILLIALPTVLGFHWMNVYQPRVSTSRAALIYLLEPVLAAAVSIVLGRDRLTGSLLVGGGLIVLGNALVELLGRGKTGE